MEKIITASDYLAREKVGSVRERIKLLSGRMYQRALLDSPFQDGEPGGTPVLAEVNHGQWLARCACGGAEAVDPSEPIFYCFNCGNRETQGKPRRVIFPEARAEIEALLLARPVDDRAGTNAIDRAFMAKPLAVGVIGETLLALERSWTPNESVEDLRAQNEFIPILVEQYQRMIGGK